MAITRDDIEAALWRWSGWQADQRAVDDILGMVERYAGTGRVRTTDVGPARTHEATSPAPEYLGVTDVTATVYTDPRGVLWVRLDPDPAVSGEPPRICTACLKSKRVLEFRADYGRPDGRRTQCRDCENEKRRIRTKRKNKVKQQIST